MSVGIAVPSGWLSSGQTAIAAVREMQRLSVSRLQVHLVSLLTAPGREALLDITACEGIKLVIHLESVDDLFGLPWGLKHSPAWKTCVLHLPVGADAAAEVRWCYERLARRGVELLIENEDSRQAAGSFVPALKAMPWAGICFDVGHEMVAPTGLVDAPVELGRVGLVHLHGVDVVSGVCHLDPWSRGAVDDDGLSRLFAVRPYVPVILEIRDLELDNFAHVIGSVHERLVGVGWRAGIG